MAAVQEERVREAAQVQQVHAVVIVEAAARALGVLEQHESPHALLLGAAHARVALQLVRHPPHARLELVQLALVALEERRVCAALRCRRRAVPLHPRAEPADLQRVVLVPERCLEDAPVPSRNHHLGDPLPFVAPVPAHVRQVCHGPLGPPRRRRGRAALPVGAVERVEVGEVVDDLRPGHVLGQVRHEDSEVLGGEHVALVPSLNAVDQPPHVADERGEDDAAGHLHARQHHCRVVRAQGPRDAQPGDAQRKGGVVAAVPQEVVAHVPQREDVGAEHVRLVP